MSSPHVAEEGVPVADLERELKYVVDVVRSPMIEAWLNTALTPDEGFPEADVWTVYYDTPAFQSIGEKINSDYLKSKIRVRWYQAPGGAQRGAVFVEAKFRVGDRRDKVRVRLDQDAAQLAGRPLSDPAFLDLPATLAPAGVIATRAWEPVLQLRYRRSRFVERQTGARVNFDRAITAVAVHARFQYLNRPTPLRVAVVEAKGMSHALPTRLHPIVALGARRASFSKYEALLSAALGR